MADSTLTPDDTQEIDGLARQIKPPAPTRPPSGASPAQAAPAAPAAPAVAAATGPRKDPLKTVFTVAWMAILLGFAVEALLLLAAAGFGTAAGPKPFIADLVQKVSWSFLVCVGLGFGNVISKAKPFVTGIFGALAAPLAFGTARSLHKGVGAALGLAAQAGGPSALVIALVKAVQYALLGWALAKIEKKKGSGLFAYAATGFAAGLLFGGVILVYSFVATPNGIPASGMVARGVSEILFPVGCSAVLYVANVLGKKAS
jgi:hypothetical protein